MGSQTIHECEDERTKSSTLSLLRGLTVCPSWATSAALALARSFHSAFQDQLGPNAARMELEHANQTQAHTHAPECTECENWSRSGGRYQGLPLLVAIHSPLGPYGTESKSNCLAFFNGIPVYPSAIQSMETKSKSQRYILKRGQTQNVFPRARSLARTRSP